MFDGDDAVELLLRGCDIADLWLIPNADTDRYNAMCRSHDKGDYLIQPVTDPPQSPEDDTAQRLAHWFLPDRYQTLPVRERLLALCRRPDEVARVTMEMDLFEAKGLLPVLRLMWFL